MDVKKIVFGVMALSLMLGGLLIFQLTGSSGCIDDGSCADLSSCISAGESVTKCNDAFIGQ